MDTLQTYLGLWFYVDGSISALVVQLLHLEPKFNPPNELAPACLSVVAAETEVKTDPAQVRMSNGVPGNLFEVLGAFSSCLLPKPT